MTIPQILLRKPAIALGLCGLIAAILNIALLTFTGDWPLFGFGFIFGIVLAGYLLSAYKLNWLRALALIALFGASWIAAFYSAIFLSDVFNQIPFGNVLLGVAAGAIGAVIVAVGFSIAYPKYFASKPILITVFVGALAGTLLAAVLYDESGPYVQILWLVWQTSVGTTLGLKREIFE